MEAILNSIGQALLAWATRGVLALLKAYPWLPLALGALAAAALVMAVAWIVRALRARGHDRNWLPGPLWSARLVSAEKDYKANLPECVLVARPDRLYRRTDGVCELVEFKTRPRVAAYLSDVVELSAQAHVLRANGFRVANRAWVVVIHPLTEQCQPVAVQLESAAQVIERVRRRLSLLDGCVRPIGASSAAVCRGCGHREICSVRRA